MKNYVNNSIYQLMIDLAKIPSISTTPEEKEMANIIYNKLSKLEYFKENSQNIKLLPVEGDLLKRNIVIAFVEAKPSTNKTVILIGHYDVVSVEVFGNLKEYAFDPLKYTKKLASMELFEEAREDLESGNYLFGRGIMDMKCGLAIQMDLIAEASKDPISLEKNLMFIAVPDEENNSVGMLEAIKYLCKFQEEKGLDYSVAINCEPSGVGDSNDNNRNVYLGTVGKNMPMFYIRGKESHGGEYFHGLNANLIASCLNLLLEANPDFTEVEGKEVFSPPCCMKHEICRERFSATVPEKTVILYNIITTSMSIEYILTQMVKVAKQAFEMAVEHLDNAKKCIFEESDNLSFFSCKPKVITFEEFYESINKHVNINLEKHVEDYINKLPSEMDIREKGICLMDYLIKFYPDKNPIIIVGFLPPYYPHRCNLRQSSNDKKLLIALNKTVQEAKIKFNEEIEIKEYFSGMCDLSYFGFQGKPHELMSLSKNMIGWGNTYKIPIDELLKLDVSILNLGPAGKDAHKYTERLELDYSLNIVPKLLRFLITNLN